MTRPDQPGRSEFVELLAHVPVGADAKDALSAEMNAHWRRYHGAGHLTQLWRRHRRYCAAEGLTAPSVERLIASAIAYHDSVCDPCGRDNEERSAELWTRVSGGAQCDERDRQWVADTIRATSNHLAYHARLDIEAAPKGAEEADAITRERARMWVLDLDLSPLGDTPANFARNSQALRREASHLSDAEWRAKQASFLGRILESPQIYRVPTLAAIYERPARRNLALQLGRISG